MFEIEKRTEIDAPPEQVFDFVADPTNHTKFMPSLMDISNVEENDVGKRGEYTFKMVGTKMDGTFTDVAFDRPNRREYELDGEIEGLVTWTIEETDDGSLVRYRSELDFPGPDFLDAITDPVVKRFSSNEIESTLRNLRILLEEGKVTA